jgi:hypothetical protein
MTKQDARVVRRLERAYSVDLSAFARTDSAGRTATPDARAEYVGLAATSALRSLRLHFTLEAGVGVLICEPDSIAAWVRKRCASDTLPPVGSLPVDTPSEPLLKLRTAPSVCSV